MLFVYLTLQGILKCDDSACGAETKKLPLMFFRGHPVCHACQRGTMTVQVNMMLVMIITVSKRSLRRLCFYTCLSVILFTGRVPGQVPPPGLGTPPPPGTRYTPHETRYTPLLLGPGTPPPPDQVHPPRTRYIPLPLEPGTPPTRPGTPPPTSSACWEIRATSGRYASYWNAFLCGGSLGENRDQNTKRILCGIDWHCSPKLFPFQRRSVLQQLAFWTILKQFPRSGVKWDCSCRFLIGNHTYHMVVKRELREQLH